MTMTILGRISGWAAVAELYPADETPGGRVFRMQSAQFNRINYGGALTIRVSNRGLGIAVWPIFRTGHPPMLIPWSALHVVEYQDRWYGRHVTVTVDTPPVARVRLPLAVMEAARAFSPAVDRTTG